MPRPRSTDPVVTKPVSLRASEWTAVEAIGLGRSACVREALTATGVLSETAPIAAPTQRAPRPVAGSALSARSLDRKQVEPRFKEGKR